jgi:TonB family protein
LLPQSRLIFDPATAQSQSRIAPPSEGRPSKAKNVDRVAGLLDDGGRMRDFILLLTSTVSLVGLAPFQDTKPCNPCEFRVAQSVAQKLQISRVEPIYPPEIGSSGTSGTVSVAYVIDKDGNAVRPICIRSEFDLPTKPELCSAATAAVTQWKYQPYRINGEPKEVETQVSLTVAQSPAPSPSPAETPQPSPTPQASPRPMKLRVSQGVAEGNVIHKVQPRYPLEAKENHIQGDVLLRVLIDRGGNIASCEQIRGDPILGKAAMEAVTQWKYRPYTIKGEPVEVETVIKVTFHM